MKTQQSIIEVKNLKLELGGETVQNNLNLTIQKGEILGIVGSSGEGKTTLLRTILGLQRPDSGSIKVLDQELTKASPDALLKLQRRWGVLFQQNALFSSLTVLENVIFPLEAHTSLNKHDMEELAVFKLLLAGLSEDAFNKFPSELSGGMQKRAALARAIALDPEILFFDEPTTGLDPDSASELDELILNLRSVLGLTIVLVTHDLDTLWRVTDRIAFLNQGKVLYIDNIAALSANPDPVVQKFFSGPRGRAAEKTSQKPTDS